MILTTSQTTLLHCQQLGKQVESPEGPLQILTDVSFRCAYGETLAITGASGSGKSTLLALLAGLDTPSSGEVRLFDQDLTTLTEDGRARLRAGRVGFVFQTFQLLPHLTALENVLLPLELVRHPDANTQAGRLLDSVGLSHRHRHYPNQLSGGEQQRVALARAYATQPKILFADEPTGNLDKATAQRVVDLMFQLNAEHQTTLVLVTHDERLAARCQQHIRLEGGRVCD